MPPTTDDVVFRVRDLTAESNGERLLDRVSLDVHRGERLGVVGDRTASTSALAYAFLDSSPDGDALPSGDLTYYPRTGDPVAVFDLDDDAIRRFRWDAVSIVGDTASGSFNPSTTIRDHFRETIAAHREETRSGMERAERLLSTFDLDPDRVLAAYPDELGGELRRIDLALALVLEPDVLVLDSLRETTGDDRWRSPLEAIQREEGFAVVALGDELPTIAALADRIVVVHEGTIVEEAPTRQLLEEPAHPFTRSLVEFFGGS